MGRLQFITTIASFVSKDGSLIEQSIINRERHNPKFSFLFSDSNIEERIFYRWRVYSFIQGDGYHYWNVEPFQMIYPHGKFWIPPDIIDYDKARYERYEKKQREDEIMNLKLNRGNKGHFMTGRQHELQNSSKDNTVVKLNNWEKEQFHTLYFTKLSISRSTICTMMSFCFDKSAAAKEISSYIHQSFLPYKEEEEEKENEDSNEVLKTIKKEQKQQLVTTIPTNQYINKLISRLYLISDVLFNSQQPG